MAPAFLLLEDRLKGRQRMQSYKTLAVLAAVFALGTIAVANASAATFTYTRDRHPYWKSPYHPCLYG